jgi:transcriptional regulator with XRE-family HTH domain
MREENATSSVLREKEKHMTFGEALRQAYESRKMTQKEAADSLGIHQPTLSQWVTETQRPSQESAGVLRRAFPELQIPVSNQRKKPVGRPGGRPGPRSEQELENHRAAARRFGYLGAEKSAPRSPRARSAPKAKEVEHCGNPECKVLHSWNGERWVCHQRRGVEA